MKYLFAAALLALYPVSAIQAEEGEPEVSVEADTSAQPDDSEALAQQLANPIANLISVPFQFNFDSGFGPDGEGDRVTLNIQPVVPISVSEDWNMISRTILPIVSQNDVIAPGSDEFGLGDTVQSLFFSPKKVGRNGIVWGVGPVLLVPTATDAALGTEKFGIGPTGVVLKQDGPITYGLLANHIWSVAGDEDRSDVNQSLLQPFFTYTTPSAMNFSLNTEIVRDWENERTTIPLNFGVGQVTRLGKQPVQLNLLGKWFVQSPEQGPDWGVRLQITFLFPAR